MILHTLLNGQKERAAVRDVAFDVSFDVVVVGLGSAGTYAALAAAETVFVLGIEQGNAPGGTGTRGFVCGYYDGVPGGMYEAYDREAQTATPLYRRGSHNPYGLQNVLTRHLSASRVSVWYQSLVIGVYTEDDGTTVTGLSVLTEDGVKNVRAGYVDDATGDGYVLSLLGIPMTSGRETDGTAAPFSLTKYYREDGEIKSIGTDAGYIRQNAEPDFSAALLRALSDVTKKKYRRVISVASLLGVREGGHFRGEYSLSLEDVLEERAVPRTLCYAASDLDRHGFDFANDAPLYRDWRIHANLATVSLKIPVPAGCLVPAGYRGILSACRCISGDSYACAAVRMRRDMQRLGECAGVAMAMAVKNGSRDILSLPEENLCAVLRSRGCFDGQPDRKRAFMEKKKPPLEFDWLTDTAQILSALDSDRPGVALWSCRRMGAAAPREALTGAMTRGTTARLRAHAALALGLLGDERCLPALRTLIRERTDTFLLDCRRSNQMPAVMAIGLCGRLGDALAVPELLPILSPGEYEREMYHTHLCDSYLYSTSATFNVIYYTYLSFALRALYEIAAAHPLPPQAQKELADFCARADDVRQKILLPGGVPDASQSVAVEGLFSLAKKIISETYNYGSL